MNTEAQVRAAKNPQEAMLAIAKALDRIEVKLVEREDVSWGEWGGTEQEFTEQLVAEMGTALDEARAFAAGGADAAVIQIPLPTAEKLEWRRQFERQYLHLSTVLGDDEDWTEAYAKGGPMWLYIANRDLVMSYPEPVRAAMVDDVIEDSPQDAHEMGRDVLKQAGETGPGSVAMRANDEIMDVPIHDR